MKCLLALEIGTCGSIYDISNWSHKSACRSSVFRSYVKVYVLKHLPSKWSAKEGQFSALFCKLSIYYLRCLHCHSTNYLAFFCFFLKQYGRYYRRAIRTFFFRLLQFRRCHFFPLIQDFHYIFWKRSF